MRGSINCMGICLLLYGVTAAFSEEAMHGKDVDGIVWGEVVNGLQLGISPPVKLSETHEFSGFDKPVSDGETFAVLSDIAGQEDHYGDMDFKVAGTNEGITALQMDIKVSGLRRDILEQALGQARQGRLQLLESMSRAIAEPRPEISPYAPRGPP